MDDWGILTSLTWTLGRPNIPKSWFGDCRLWRLAFHPVVDTTLSGWLCVCLGHTMEERLLTLKIIGSKTRDDNSKLYKMHFQRPYLLVKKQENTPPASCPSSKRRWWRNCAPSCQQADFSPPGLSAAPPGGEDGRVISSWLPGERGAAGGHQVYLEGTDDVGKFEVIMLWESLVTVLHKETLPDICIGIPCNGHVTF